MVLIWIYTITYIDPAFFWGGGSIVVKKINCNYTSRLGFFVGNLSRRSILKKTKTVGVYVRIVTLSFYQQIGLKFDEETSEMLRLEHGSVWC